MDLVKHLEYYVSRLSSISNGHWNTIGMQYLDELLAFFCRTGLYYMGILILFF